MSMLVEAGCKVTWNNNQCMVRHPTPGCLDISLRSVCPELNLLQAREVTADLEKRRLQELEENVKAFAAKLKALNSNECTPWKHALQDYVAAGRK